MESKSNNIGEDNSTTSKVMKAELKPEDFRLGNLITYEGEVFAIDEITKHLIRSGPLTINSIGLKAIDCGIELSEEWLKKAGFAYHHAWADNFVRGCITIYNNPLKQGWTIESIEPNFEIYYIHQLQNLWYALTNSELTLKEKVI